MATKEQLVEYVRITLQRGVSKEEIKNSLILYNWTNDEINEAFRLALGQENINYSMESEIGLNKASKIVKFVLIFLIIILAISITGVITYFIFSLTSSESEAAIINDGKISVKCESDEDCIEELKCVEKICIEVSGEDSSGAGEGSSTRKPSGNNFVSGGSSGETIDGATGVQIIDCKTNLDCFINAAEICSLAKVIHNYETRLFGVFAKSNSMYYELKGIESEKCLFYLKQEEKDGTCKMATEDLLKTLKIWKDDGLQVGTFSEDIWKNSECKGSYFS